jgi:ATP-binding cassette subfamily B protein
MLGISEAAEKIGFRTRGVKVCYGVLSGGMVLPCIVHWNQNHFVVLYSITRWGRARIADPARGILSLTPEEFKSHWISSLDDQGQGVGTLLMLEPGPSFFDEEGEKQTRLSWGLVTQYLKNYRWSLTQVVLAMLLASGFQLIFPYLTQSIVDTGINTRNLRYITILLTGQLVLIFSRSIVDFIRSRLLLTISIMININILSDFWIKLTRLPLSYFDSHQVGDTMQRLNDNRNIQDFLTGTALNTMFSILNFVVFAFVLCGYSLELFTVFLSGSLLYLVWILFFLKVRRKINYATFHLSARENNATLELVQGMQEIRLNNAEHIKRWKWEDVQAKVFRLNLKTLTYSQIQQIGAILINQGKDVIVIFIAADSVIKGDLTFGAMLAIQYILGQLSSPVEQFVNFIQKAQDAKISMDRLNDIHKLRDEELPDIPYIGVPMKDRSLRLADISFSYPGSFDEPVLRNINLLIPEGKTTAIVGASGSGKTTLLKLLLKIHDSYEGEIKIGSNNFKYLNPGAWRRQCGAVLQDGYIFDDSIARNIAVGDETPDFSKLTYSCKTANILSFIESLPNGFFTALGAKGMGISQGQKQRLLIARALYKEPAFLFFDEATNALDATNEREIIDNLRGIFNSRTVVVVAHRLSTVKNADKIVVLQDGGIVEEGPHQQLSALKGKYYELVKNQLDLGM